MTDFNKELNALIAKIKEISALEDKVNALNQIKLALHEVSPFKDEPVDCVQWVSNQTVQANDYNPNSVAKTEMKLLEHSIREDGYTQPIVTWSADQHLEVVDGFHRNVVGKTVEDITTRIHSYLPVVIVNTDRTKRTDRMAATIRHNRARGKHKVEAMSEIVQELFKGGWTDKRIGKELGMSADEVLRLKQITGLAELFADREFSQAWEPVED